MRSTAIVVLALVAIGLFVAACSTQPQTTGTTPSKAAPSNELPVGTGDAGAQLQDSFDSNLPPDPTAQPQPTDNLSKDLVVN